MAVYNALTWNRGEDVLLSFTQQPVPTNISGWTISFRIKVALSDAVALLTLPGVVVDGPNGLYTVSISAANDTNVLTAGQYFHAVVRTDNGAVGILSQGPVLLTSTAYLL